VAELDQLMEQETDPSPLLGLDLALFDAGGLTEYLSERGGMLLADERELIEGWAGATTTAYEVVEVGRGDALALRPLLGGDQVTVRDHRVASSVRRLDLLVGRVLHDGERPRIITPMTRVPRGRRRQLMAVFADPSPAKLAAFFGPQPPPRLANRDGDELVFGTAEYEVPGAGAAWTKLAASLEETDRDHLTWVLDIDGEQVHGGAVSRNGRIWTVEANSVERLREIHEIVLSAAPGAKLVSETTEPAGRSFPGARATGSTASGPTKIDSFRTNAVTDDEIQEAIREHIREYQQRWLDMSIPGLGGRTPRAAAAEGGDVLDELRAMLDDFEWQGEGQMSVDWMRAELGLT